MSHGSINQVQVCRIILESSKRRGVRVSTADKTGTSLMNSYKVRKNGDVAPLYNPLHSDTVWSKGPSHVKKLYTAHPLTCTLQSRHVVESKHAEPHLSEQASRL